MNIFKHLLYLHGDLRDAPFAQPPRSYATGLGNKAATSEAFPPLRGAPARQARGATAPAPALAASGCR